MRARPGWRRADLVTAAAGDYTPPMSDPPDMEDLARRYLDLWQSQMSALATDPQVADTLNRLKTALSDRIQNCAIAMERSASYFTSRVSGYAACHPNQKARWAGSRRRRAPFGRLRVSAMGLGCGAMRLLGSPGLTSPGSAPVRP